MPLEKRKNAAGGYDYIVTSDPMPDEAPRAPVEEVFPEHATVLLTRGGVTQVIRPEAKE